MKAERDKRAQILEAEGPRQAVVLKAEGEKQAVVLAAEGRKEAALRDAEARERAAQAEAEATEMVSQAIAGGNVQAINYFVANNYVKALEAIARSPNQKVLMMPLEASSVIGSWPASPRSRARPSRVVVAAHPWSPAAAATATAACPPRSGEFARPGTQPGANTMPSVFSFAGLGAWNWFILAAVLFILETFLALSLIRHRRHRRGRAGAVHRRDLAVTWPWQVIAFGVLAVATVFWIRRYVRPDVAPSDPARP
jgi:hypothetical protein